MHDATVKLPSLGCVARLQIGASGGQLRSTHEVFTWLGMQPTKLKFVDAMQCWPAGQTVLSQDWLPLPLPEDVNAVGSSSSGVVAIDSGLAGGMGTQLILCFSSTHSCPSLQWRLMHDCCFSMDTQRMTE